MKIENMISNAGNKIKNQFKIYDGCITYFKSYNSVVAAVSRKTGETKLYKDWGYSNTTRKYLYQFLWECGRNDLSNRKKLEKAIKAETVKVYDNSPEF